MKTLSFRVSDDEYNQIQRLSDKESRSMSSWIRFTIKSSFVGQTKSDNVSVVPKTISKPNTGVDNWTPGLICPDCDMEIEIDEKGDVVDETTGKMICNVCSRIRQAKP